MPTNKQTIAGLALREINGVKVLSAKCDGPFVAQLTFRVGMCDETLPTRGITHLVEHLALTNSGSAPHAYNGETGFLFTTFVATGEPPWVSDHLNQICRSLRHLPVERLEHERGVIRTEASRRGASIEETLVKWRWGATPFGLPSYDELGIETLRAETTQAWARSRFTADNAVLWLSGDVPSGLELDLPSGGGVWPVETDPYLSVTTLPASFSMSDKLAAFSFVSPRTPADRAVPDILRERLRGLLRDQLGLSYSVRKSSRRLTADATLHMIVADCLPENATAVQRGISQILTELRAAPPESVEVEAARLSQEIPTDERLATLSRLNRVAESLLLGERPLTPRAIATRVRGITPEAVWRSAIESLPTLLMAVPKADLIDPTLATSTLGWSANRVRGTRYAPSPHSLDRRLTDLYVGPNGISVVVGAAHAITVRYDACRAMKRYQDGSRTLFGVDGNSVSFAPDDWQGASHVGQLLDLNVDQTLWIDGGQRREVLAGSTAKAAKIASARQSNLRRNAKRGTPIAGGVVAVGIIVAALLRQTTNSTPPTPLPPDQQIATDAFQSGQCVSTIQPLPGGKTDQVDCSQAHLAEVIDVIAADSASGLDCATVASLELPPDVVSSITPVEVPDAAGNYVCFATHSDGSLFFNGPLRRN